jgi:hypothetical protein
MNLQSYTITINGDGYLWVEIIGQDLLMDGHAATAAAQELKDVIDPILRKWRNYLVERTEHLKEEK